MKAYEEIVGQHYDDENAFDYERKRYRLCTAEFEIIVRQIERWIPDTSVVAEVGVGDHFLFIGGKKEK